MAAKESNSVNNPARIIAARILGKKFLDALPAINKLNRSTGIGMQHLLWVYAKLKVEASSKVLWRVYILGGIIALVICGANHLPTRDTRTGK